MASLNKAMVIGGVTRDPEVRMAGNSKVTELSLAINEKFNDKNGNKKENTEYVNIQLWGKLADIAEQYITRGSQVYIEGKIVTQSWDDKEGNKKYKTIISGYSMQMLGGGNRREQEDNNQRSQPSQIQDDLPF